MFLQSLTLDLLFGFERLSSLQDVSEASIKSALFDMNEKLYGIDDDAPC